MSKSNTFENQWLLHEFQNANIANIGDATGLRGSTTAGSLYVALHTADPGEAGDAQTTSEAAYTGYARVAVARSSAGWTVTGSVASPFANIDFPTGTAGSGSATYFTIGTAASGAGQILRRGTVTPAITMGNGIAPRLTTATQISED